MFTVALTPLLSLVLLFQAASGDGSTNSIAGSDSVAVAPAPTANAPNTYTLGAGDQIVVRVSDVEEITDKPIPIDSRGSIDLPMIGRIQAAGLTTEQLESAMHLRLKKYLVDPDVSVHVAEMRSQPISVLGAVQHPGVHQLQGEKNLFEVLSLAGGLDDHSGSVVKITRKLQWGRIPLPDAKDDPSGQFSVASVNVKEIMSASSPAQNILIKPEDVISVPRAEVIYAIGAVKKPGGYVLGQNQSLSVLQVLSLAEGLEKTASTSNVKIMRAIPGTDDRTEIPFDLKKIIDGKASDVPLQAGDIFFVPNSRAKTITYRAADAMVTGASLLFYHIP